ncbi:hypothetical protein [Rossellomorea aquimaris]|uniref:Uncharacterized protein n=1 Tax=Rossellomorea aquimaris TaxID=189382 RepID=A0A366EWZ4_9BACI|nr:hypothetical protein [Rossellomorea aquimaris]RBP06220.1 hypothetical protein DET59_103352 [Rossellomorea aquimaris]
MSRNRELLTILQTLQTYSDCDITQSFSEHDSDVLLVSYSKELNSFVITHHDSEKSYHDIDSALTILENVLQT